MQGIYAKTAWRNVFRNRRRSYIVISAVGVAVAGGMLIVMFVVGLYDQMVNAAIRDMGHIQIQHPEFIDNPGVNRAVSDPDDVIQAIERTGIVAHWAPRIEIQGLARAAAASAGVIVRGVDAEREQHMTNMAERIVEGEYLTGESTFRRREIVLGSRLAEKLDVGIGSRVVLTVQGRVDGSDDTEMTSGMFRVAGIFTLPSETMNESTAFINLADAQTLLNMGTDVSRISVILVDPEELDAARTQFADALSSEQHEVRTWRDGNPTLVQILELGETAILIYVIVVFLGAAFGIINTMLMAVFERTREFGILRAIGTSRQALFRMVLYEAFFICVLGTILGFVIIGTLYAVWLRGGLDLTMFAEGLAAFGSDAVIQPMFDLALTIQVIIAVLCIGVLSAVWPAVRAARLQPAETMRHN